MTKKKAQQSSGAGKTRFIRVGGRIIPIRPKKVTSAAKKVVGEANNVQQSVVTGIAVGAAAKGLSDQAGSYFGEKSNRFFKIASGFGKREEPRIPAMKKVGRKILAPDMFEMNKYRRAQTFYKAGQAKSLTFAARGLKFAKYANLFKRHGTKGAIGIGIASGLVMFAATQD